MTTHNKIPWSKTFVATESIPDHLAEYFESESYDSHIVITGLCPECYGPIRLTHEKRFAVSSGTDVLVGQGGSDEINWDVIMVCNCGLEHPSRPKDETGCGMELMVRVTDEASN
jgi:hypothetical protein